MWLHRRGRPLCLPEQQMPTTNTQRGLRWVFGFCKRADNGVCPYTLNALFMEIIILIMIISFR